MGKRRWVRATYNNDSFLIAPLLVCAGEVSYRSKHLSARRLPVTPSLREAAVLTDLLLSKEDRNNEEAQK